MNFGRIVALLFLLIGLGSYIFYYERPQAEADAKKEKLVAVDKDAITGMVLKFPDREIELKKVDAVWRLVRPVDAPADDVTVKGIITALTDADVQKAIDEMPSDLEPFGLIKPEPLVSLTLAAGTAPAIAIGGATKIGGKAYVRRGEEPKVLLTAASIRLSLNKQAKDLRDKQVLTFKDDDITAVSIQSAEGGTVTLTKKGVDAWAVDPGNFPADINEVRAYLSSLRGARAIEFPDDAPTDLTKYGLTTPRLRVTMSLGEGKAQTLLIGSDLTEGTQKQLYAQRDGTPTVVTLGDFTLKSLGKDVKALRDKSLLGFDTARVGKITLARKDGAVTSFIHAPDGAWSVEGQESTKSKSTTIERFLDDTHDLRGSDIAAEPATNLGAFGLDAPDLRITLIDKEQQPMGTLLAAKKDSKYFALREGSQTAFEVRDYMFTRLDKQAKDFINDGSPTPPPAAVPTGDDDSPLEAPGGEEDE